MAPGIQPLQGEVDRALKILLKFFFEGSKLHTKRWVLRCLLLALRCSGGISPARGLELLIQLRHLDQNDFSNDAAIEVVIGMPGGQGVIHEFDTRTQRDLRCAPVDEVPSRSFQVCVHRPHLPLHFAVIRARALAPRPAVIRFALIDARAHSDDKRDIRPLLGD